MGFIAYKKYFFLNNILSKEDVLAKATHKLDIQINIAAGMSSLAGLIPIPFADIPIILALEVGIIEYTAKLYGFNDNEYNTTKLMTFGPGGISIGTVAGGVSKILLFSNFLDVIPIVGAFISTITNPATIKTFGYSIKRYFIDKITDEKIINMIKLTLNDYKSIYLQIKQLSNDENNICKKIKENGNNKIVCVTKNENLTKINPTTKNSTNINNIQDKLVNNHIDSININVYSKPKVIYKKKIIGQNKINIPNKKKDNEEEKKIDNFINRKIKYEKK